MHFRHGLVTTIRELTSSIIIWTALESLSLTLFSHAKHWYQQQLESTTVAKSDFVSISMMPPALPGSPQSSSQFVDATAAIRKRKGHGTSGASESTNRAGTPGIDDGKDSEIVKVFFCSMLNSVLYVSRVHLPLINHVAFLTDLM